MGNEKSAIDEVIDEELVLDGEATEEGCEDESTPMRPRDRLKKGAYLFPNLLTTAGLMAGFLSIGKTFDGNFVFAAWAIVLAAVFDGLDGKIARLTNTTSEFGIQYDSLADLVSFGVAPSVLIYQFALRHGEYPGLGWAIALIYMTCGALRLARFNIQTATTGGGKWFVGVPIPAGAGIITSTVLFLHNIGWITADGIASTPNLLTILTLVVALAMVTTLPYWSMKDAELFRRRRFGVLLGMIIFMAVVIREPERTLFFLGIAYLCSGPIIWHYRRKATLESK